jgi:DNA-binding transcriptional ArsR family regulator
MAISEAKRSRSRPQDSCVLQAGQRLILSRPSHNCSTTIFAEQGIIRLSTVANDINPEITVALISSLDNCTFHHPSSENLQVEAITESIIMINNEQKIHTANEDFLQEWIFQLYTVRHPIKTEERLRSLLRLLILKLGIRTPEGYKLKFLLSHSRLAEMIGATRSTVSRSLGVLKEKGIISIDEMRGELIVKDSQLISSAATRITLPL